MSPTVELAPLICQTRTPASRRQATIGRRRTCRSVRLNRLNSKTFRPLFSFVRDSLDCPLFHYN